MLIFYTAVIIWTVGALVTGKRLICQDFKSNSLKSTLWPYLTLSLLWPIVVICEGIKGVVSWIFFW